VEGEEVHLAPLGRHVRTGGGEIGGLDPGALGQWMQPVDFG